jgi:hypothetical protein
MQMNSVQTFPFSFRQIHFNIVFPSTLRSSRFFFKLPPPKSWDFCSNTRHMVLLPCSCLIILIIFAKEHKSWPFWCICFRHPATTFLLVKVKVTLEQATKAQRGSRGVTTLSLTSALDGWVVNATPRPLYPRERPATHCIGGWVGPRTGLDGCGKSRLHRDSIPGPSSP